MLSWVGFTEEVTYLVHQVANDSLQEGHTLYRVLA